MTQPEPSAERIEQRYLGELNDTETIDDLEAVAKFAGGDFALEFRGDKLHIFRIVTGVRS